MTRLLVPIDSDVKDYRKFELYVDLNGIGRGDVVYLDEDDQWLNRKFNYLPQPIQNELGEIASSKVGKAKPEELEKVLEGLGNVIRSKYENPPKNLERYDKKLELLGDLRHEDSNLWDFYKVRDINIFTKHLKIVLEGLYQAV